MGLNYEVHGIFGEDPCVPVHNTNMFKAFHDNKRVKAVFIGHDHDNNF